MAWPNFSVRCKDEDPLAILRLGKGSMSAQMASQANPRSEGFLAVRTGGGRWVWHNPTTTEWGRGEIFLTV